MVCNTVTATQAFDPSAVAVTTLDVPTSVTVGQSVSATATVHNGNDRTASADVRFSVDGSTVTTRTINVPARSSNSVTVSVSLGTAGDHNVCAEVVAAS